MLLVYLLRMEKKYHYIYKITCLCGKFKGHYYIGKRSTNNNPESDGYYGSGVVITDYYKKYPPVIGETITKDILEFNDSLYDNCKREAVIIGDKYKTDPLCMNLMGGGLNGSPGEEARRHMGSARKGDKNPNYGKPKSDDFKEKVRKKLKGHAPYFGKEYTMSDETRKKISDTLTGKPGLSGSNHPMWGKHHSDEAKKKISEASKGRKMSEETKKKIGEANKGKILSEKTKEKLRIANKGKHLSEEHKEKLRKAHIGKKQSPEIIEKRRQKLIGHHQTTETIEKIRSSKTKYMKMVVAIKDGEEPIIFNSCADAMRTMKAYHIQEVINGERNYCAGYKWMYYDDYKKIQR